MEKLTLKPTFLLPPHPPALNLGHPSTLTNTETPVPSPPYCQPTPPLPPHIVVNPKEENDLFHTIMLPEIIILTLNTWVKFQRA